MTALHIHMKVNNLDSSIAFYTGLFQSPPTTQKADYAKWQLEEPALNFSIAQTGAKAGIEHLGFQADSAEELQTLYQRADAAEGIRLEEGHTECCYARSEKSWVKDPDGISWELFHTYGESGQLQNNPSVEAESGSCCAPTCCAPANEATVNA